MDIKPCHKALEQMLIKIFKEFFIIGVQPTYQQQMQCNDTDSVKYKIHGVHQKVFLYMICIDVQKIWNHSNQHFVTKYYPQFKVSLSEFKNQKAVQILIDNDLLTSFTQNFKQPNQSGILTGKKKLDAVFAQISRRLACVKRHFFASPYEMMLNAAKSNEEKKAGLQVKSFSYYTKPDRKEKIWLAFEKNQFTVHYGINFEDKFEQQLADKYFTELVDSTKRFQNAPGVNTYKSQLSEFLIKSFPQEKSESYKFSNGIVSVSKVYDKIALFGKLIKAPQRMATYLAGFRNYAYYHIQSEKGFLHARILKQINDIDKNLKNSIIEKETAKRFSTHK